MKKTFPFRLIKGVYRSFVFPFLKYLLDPPSELIDKTEHLIKFEKNHTISYDFIDILKKNSKYIYIDSEFLYQGLFPTIDFIGREIDYSLYDFHSQQLVSVICKKKKYKIYSAWTLRKVVKRFRKEIPIIKEYLNLYMSLYSLASGSRKILKDDFYKKEVMSILKHWVIELDDYLKPRLKKKRNLRTINAALGVLMYLYFKDALILCEKIDAFNHRITGGKFPNKHLNKFKKLALDVLAYSILRQKIRINLTLIAINSFLRIKKENFYKNKMATLMQLTKKKLRDEKKNKYSRAPILKKNPQRRGVCTKVYKMAPKKPCSARRSVAWVLFIKNEEKKGTLCHIPGETHNLRMYSRVLVRGGRVKDLPGVRCRIVRTTHSSVSDLQGLYKRTNSRSRYGARNNIIVHNSRVYRYAQNNPEFWKSLNISTNIFKI